MQSILDLYHQQCAAQLENKQLSRCVLTFWSRWVNIHIQFLLLYQHSPFELDEAVTLFFKKRMDLVVMASLQLEQNSQLQVLDMIRCHDVDFEKTLLNLKSQCQSDLAHINRCHRVARQYEAQDQI